MGEETNATEPIMNFAETLHDFEIISRRCRDMLYEAHEREVDALRGDTYLDAVSDSVLAKHGLVRLPVDADGVPIRIGDVMEWCDSGETLTVEGIGRDVLFYIDGENAEWTAARNKRHHHAPDRPADTPASLADELESLADGVDGRVPQVPDDLRDIADRLRKMGGAE